MNSKLVIFSVLFSSFFQLEAFSEINRDIIYDCSCVIGKKDCLWDIPESTPPSYAKLEIYLKPGDEHEWRFNNWDYRDYGEVDKSYRGSNPSYKNYMKLVENWRLGQSFRSTIYLPKNMLQGSQIGHAIYVLPEENIILKCNKRAVL